MGLTDRSRTTSLVIVIATSAGTITEAGTNIIGTGDAALANVFDATGADRAHILKVLPRLYDSRKPAAEAREKGQMELPFDA